MRWGVGWELEILTFKLTLEIAWNVLEERPIGKLNKLAIEIH